jgi:hypothetical protein
MPVAASSLPASANIIALSSDRALVDLLRDSLAGMHRVWRADDVAHAGELIVAASNAVFLVDASLADCDTRDLVNRLHQQFPDLAIIVAGRPEDEAQLVPLLSSGVIFRYLHYPASAEDIHKTLEATQLGFGSKTDLPVAARRPAFPAAIAVTRPAISFPKFTLPKFNLPKISVDRALVRLWSGRCLRLVTLLLSVWALSLWKPWNYAAELFVSRDPPPAANVDISNDSKLLALLNAAGIALAKNRLVEPPRHNALELYRAVLAIDPDNDLAQRGIDSVADKLFSEAELALQARDLPRLASAIDAARSARPNHPRLEYYSLELKRERERKFGSERP